MKSFNVYKRTEKAHSSRGSFFSPILQPKLTVNAPGDTYEQEADRVADQVMRMPAFDESSASKRKGDAPIVQQMSLTPVAGVQRKCAECEQEDQAQRKETGSASGGFQAPSIVGQVISGGGGRPMDGGTRKFMESRFGQDFGQVRIHTGSQATESAEAIGARAYTSRNHIVFGRGAYQPGNEEGKRLLAHELTHTIQQRDWQSVQRQLTSFPEQEQEDQPVQMTPLSHSISRTPYAMLQRRGGTAVGTLCIRSNAVNQGLTAGHAWLSYTPMSGSETTYGTWGNRSPIGLHRDLEVGFPYAASRCTDVDSTDVAALNTFATSNNAWTLTNNCSSFAARGWRHVTGESIPHKTFFIPNPSALGSGIISLGSTLAATAPAATAGSSSSGSSGSSSSR